MWKSQRYLGQGRKAGIPEEILQNAVSTAGEMKLGLPPVLSLNHLSFLAKVPHKELREIVERTASPYTNFRIEKRPLPGEPIRYRIISVPSARLMRVQRWIDQHILKRIQPDEASMAFSEKNSVVEAAMLHCNAKWLVKVDVKNFFESITEQQVYRVFREVGYQPLVSFELARICTRQAVTPKHGKRWRSGVCRWTTIPSYYALQLGYLPQGAPTSPRLSNLVARSLDVDVRKIATAEGLRYTRYADDLVLSSDTVEFRRSLANKIIGQLHDALRSNGFSPNMAKTQIVPPRGRKVVLGLGVETDQPKLTRQFKARVRQHIYYLRHPDFGPARHAEECGGASIYGLRNHVQGLLAFAKGVEPEFANKYTAEFQKIKWP